MLDEADKMLSQGLHPQLRRIRHLVLPGRGKRCGAEGPVEPADASGSLLLTCQQRIRPQVNGTLFGCSRQSSWNWVLCDPRRSSAETQMPVSQA